MSYQESEIVCDWCKKRIYSNDQVACQSCHENLDKENDDLKDEIRDLQKIIEDLEKEKV